MSQLRNRSEAARAPGEGEVTAQIRAALNRKALASVRHRTAAGALLGLRDREMLAVAHLALEGRLTVAELGERLRLSSAGATALVQRLERAGQVAREPHVNDRRSMVLRLTREAERAAGEVFAPFVRELDALILGLPPEHRLVVRDFLAAVAAAAERHADALVRHAKSPPPDALGVSAPGLWA